MNAGGADRNVRFTPNAVHLKYRLGDARRSATLRGDLDQFAFWVPSLLAVDIDQDDAIALDAIAALFNNAAIESLGSFKGFCSSQNLPSDG